MAELGEIQDYNDLYDHEVKKVRLVTAKLQLKYGGKQLFDPDTGFLRRSLFEEINKWAEEELYRAGLRGGFTIDVTNGNPTLEVRGRVQGASEEKYGFDHERKRDEVLKANERGEKFLGENGK